MIFLLLHLGKSILRLTLQHSLLWLQIGLTMLTIRILLRHQALML